MNIRHVYTFFGIPGRCITGLASNCSTNTVSVALFYQEVGSCVNSLLTFETLKMGFVLSFSLLISFIASVNPSAARELLPPVSHPNPPKPLYTKWNVVFIVPESS